MPKNIIPGIKIDDVEGLAECEANIKKWSDEVIRRNEMLTVEGKEALEKIDSIKAKIAELENKKVELTTIQNNKEESTNKVTVETDLSKVDELKSELDSLEDKKIEITTIERKEEVSSGNNTVSNTVTNNTINSISNNVENNTINQTTNRDTNETINKEFTEIVIDDSDIKKVDEELIALKNQLLIEQVKIGIKPELEDGSVNSINN